MPESTRRGRRGPIPTRSRAEIATAAAALADADGLTAVTIRAIAASLGVAPAALYRYVSSRDELVEPMVDRALDDFDLPAPSGDVIGDLIAMTRAQTAVLRRHPWLIETMPVVPPGPNAIRWLEAGLRVLEPVRSSGTAKLEALAMLTGAASLFARMSSNTAPRTVDAIRTAAATHPGLAAAFADPGVPSAPDALLQRTVGALARGLLGLR